MVRAKFFNLSESTVSSRINPVFSLVLKEAFRLLCTVIRKRDALKGEVQLIFVVWVMAALVAERP
jgi:hypothetical protein